MAVDVIQDYPWCINTDDTQLLKECPKITVQFHKMKDNGVVRKINASIAAAKNTNASDYYKNLYDTEKEETFVFPYFDGEFVNYNNTFSDNIQNGSGYVNVVADGVQNFVGAGYAVYEDMMSTYRAVMEKYEGGDFTNKTGRAVYVETPQYQQFGINGSGINVKFVLLNTNTSKGYEKNIKLVKRLSELCKPTRQSSIFVEPVKICKIQIHGYRNVPWAYCTNITVNGLGTKRMVGSGILPEAYEVNMSFAPMVMEDVSADGSSI